jgi:TonB family protein
VPNFENRGGGALPPGNPDVHLTRLIAPEVLDLPWYRSLYGNIRDLIHPPRLPPLELTSRPVEVKDIWGLYGRQKKSFILSAGFQVAIVAVVALVGLTNSRVPREVGNLIRRVYLDTAPADVPRVHPSAKTGGGSGGDGSLLRASHGNLAPAKPRQWVPPQAVINNPDAKLTMNPSIVAVDAVYVDPSIRSYGDPFAPNGPLSNGPGHGGGIGDKCCGGQGTGDGNGAGPGHGGPGFGDPVFVAGRSGLVNPVVLYKPEPDYSDDARKAKLQGTVLLEVVVDANGQPQIRKVLQPLGMGLDEQAIKTVSTWRFKAGRMDGKPVPVLINVSVSFRLL